MRPLRLEGPLARLHTAPVLLVRAGAFVVSWVSTSGLLAHSPGMRLFRSRPRTPARLAHVVGLIGHARSGKDTFASFLIAEAGYQRFAFADPMKSAALALDPIVRIETDETGHLSLFPQTSPIHRRLSSVVGDIGWERAKEIREVRRTLQRLGTEMGRDVLGEDVWVRTTLDKALPVATREHPVVITDVRFPNEAEAISAAGGVLVRIVRPGSGAVGATALHSSETALDGWHTDFTVLNDSTLRDLSTQAANISGRLALRY